MALIVGDEYRTHLKSRYPGGGKVKVTLKGKTPLIYDKIKNIEAYVESVLRNNQDVLQIEVMKPDETWEIIYSNIL